MAHLIFQFPLDLEPSGYQNLTENDIVYSILNIPAFVLRKVKMGVKKFSPEKMLIFLDLSVSW